MVTPDSLTNSGPATLSPTSLVPRVLILQTHAKNGGTQQLSRLLHEGLSQRGYEVFELFLVRASNSLHSGPNVFVGDLQEARGLAHHFRMAASALREIRHWRPDVVLCLQWGGNMLGAWTAPLAGSPVVIANQFDSPTQMPRIARWIDRLQGSAGSFAKIVVNTCATEATFADYPQRYRERIVRIEHGVLPKTSTLSKAQARAAFGLPIEGTLIGSLGRLVPGKRFDVAINLLDGHPDWRLVLFGHGPEEKRLRAAARSLGCADRLHLAGEIDADRVGDAIAALDVFVFPSEAETFGLAAVEAALAGIPVVARDLPSLREVLAADGEPCAVFVDPDDARRLADAVSSLLHDELLRAGLRKASRRLGDRFSLEKMFDQYDQLIRAALIAAQTRAEATR